MEIEEFLKRFLQFGLKEGYFKIVAVKDLPKVCCPNSTTEVIDFDETTRIYCKKTEMQSLPSCDALKIIPEKQRFDFIEFKGLKEYIKKNPDISVFENKVKNFNLIGKIRDSIHILYAILNNKKNPTKQMSSDREYYFKIEKNYIVVTDIEDGIEGLTATLVALSEYSTLISIPIIEKMLIDEIENNINDIRLIRPILKRCQHFDTFYQKEGIC